MQNHYKRYGSYYLSHETHKILEDLWHELRATHKTPPINKSIIVAFAIQQFAEDIRTKGHEAKFHRFVAEWKDAFGEES